MQMSDEPCNLWHKHTLHNVKHVWNFLNCTICIDIGPQKKSGFTMCLCVKSKGLVLLKACKHVLTFEIVTIRQLIYPSQILNQLGRIHYNGLFYSIYKTKDLEVSCLCTCTHKSI